MKKKILLIPLALLLATGLVATACAAPEAPPVAPPVAPPAPAPSPVEPVPAAYEWPDTFLIVTNPIGTSSHAVAAGVGAALEEDTGMKVRVLPEEGHEVMFQRVFRNEVDAVSYLASFALSTFYGEGVSARYQVKPLWIVWSQKTSPYAPIVRGDSDIHTLSDLARPGLRVAFEAGSSFNEILARQVLPYFAGVTPEWAAKNWKFVPTPGYTNAIRSVGDGRSDVYSIGGPESGITIEVAASPRGLRFLSLDIDNPGWAQFYEHFPSESAVVISTGAKEAHGKVGFTLGSYLFISEALIEDEEFQYQLAKWFDENYDLYKGIHVAASYMQRDKFKELLDAACLPVAPGTIRYLKEVGLWSAEDDAWFGEMEKLVMKYVDASAASFAEAKAKEVKIANDSKEWLELWASYKADLPRFRGRE